MHLLAAAVLALNHAACSGPSAGEVEGGLGCAEAARGAVCCASAAPAAGEGPAPAMQMAIQTGTYAGLSVVSCYHPYPRAE